MPLWSVALKTRPPEPAPFVPKYASFMSDEDDTSPLYDRLELVQRAISLRIEANINVKLAIRSTYPAMIATLVSLQVLRKTTKLTCTSPHLSAPLPERPPLWYITCCVQKSKHHTRLPAWTITRYVYHEIFWRAPSPSSGLHWPQPRETTAPDETRKKKYQHRKCLAPENI